MWNDVMTALPHRPCPVILAAPSGTGKTTIAHALVDRFDHFVFSVSATTRPPREGEVDGEDYDFLTRDAFVEMMAAGELAEWAEVHGNLYGTPLRNLDAAAERGEHALLDIDVQGARQIRDRIPDAVLIFIFPPSADDLVKRLTARGTESTEEVTRRLRAAQGELEAARDFDYIVVNDDLEHAVAQVRAIVEAEGHRPARATDFLREVARLRSEIDGLLAHPPLGSGAPSR